jgi:hypothetical protein
MGGEAWELSGGTAAEGCCEGVRSRQKATSESGHTCVCCVIATGSEIWESHDQATCSDLSV